MQKKGSPILNNEKPWWKDAIGYQIYPRSFNDSNGDGIGDIPGIIDKLDYLKDLGVTLLWIGPFFKSPMDDGGYDIQDYLDVDPIFGTKEDAIRLIDEAHRRDIKIIIDLVLNHTSDEHPWFIEARKNRYSKYHSYYIWKEPKMTAEGKILPPTNWQGYFGESAWEYDETAKQYYLRIFSKKMPDLNLEYKPLREAMFDVARHWLNLGIDGFRMDAIAHLAKDLTFTDSYQQVDHRGITLDASKFSSLPRLFDYLQEFKQNVLDQYPQAVAIGEVGGNVTPEQSLTYSGYENGPLQMVFNFDTCWENGAYGSELKSDLDIKTNVINLKQNFLKWYEQTEGKAWLPIYWLNHDHPRVLSQYGSIQYRHVSAKMLITTLLFMYGTPFIYNGDEIGMSNVDYEKLTQFKDVSALNYAREASNRLDEATILRFLRRTSRINARTPMQWDDSPFAGFSMSEPYLRVNGNYRDVNVKQQQNDPHSILNFYKRAIALRKTSPWKEAVQEGSFSLVDSMHPDVFAYFHDGPEKLFVVSNFRNYETRFKMPYIVQRVLLHNYDHVMKQGLILNLRAFESIVFHVESI